MRKLKEYQKKAIESEKKVVFCNWNRESGKTFTIAEAIIGDFSNENKNENVVIISKCSGHIESKIIYEYLEKHVRFEVLRIINCENCIKITNKNNITHNLYFIQESKMNNSELLRGLRIDKIYFDEHIPSEKEIKHLLNVGDVKKIKIFCTCFDNKDFEYISDFEYKLDKRNWVSDEMDKLMKEYSSITKAENTTIRREKILLQIKMLDELRKGN